MASSSGNRKWCLLTYVNETSLGSTNWIYLSGNSAQSRNNQRQLTVLKVLWPPKSREYGKDYSFAYWLSRCFKRSCCGVELPQSDIEQNAEVGVDFNKILVHLRIVERNPSPSRVIFRVHFRYTGWRGLNGYHLDAGYWHINCKLPIHFGLLLPFSGYGWKMDLVFISVVTLAESALYFWVVSQKLSIKMDVQKRNSVTFLRKSCRLVKSV